MAGPAPAFPGFSYDWAGAQSIASILGPLMATIAGANVTTNTQVAGLALLVAKVIAQSKLKNSPEAAIAAVSAYLTELLGRAEIP
jgi:hypothetical protein